MIELAAPLPSTLVEPAGYAQWRQWLDGTPLPAAVLDFGQLRRNALAMLRAAGDRPIRLGTKSIRCVEVLRRVQALSPRFRGLLCYSAREAAWLAAQGFNDLLVAYPTTEPADLAAAAEVLRAGGTLRLMVDSAEQLPALEMAGQAHGVRWPLCIDMDMSMHLPGIHFGVRRSALHSADAVLALARQIGARASTMRVTGLMGYEAQIAGLPDRVPSSPLRSALVRALKSRSRRDVAARRGAAVDALARAGFTLELVNGGGTGSLDSTSADDSVTEASAGSGLYAPVLFDEFAGFHYGPALCFALRVERRPAAGMVTCSGGGYVASGPAGADRLPQPYLPAGLRLLPQEGAGEVQTPLRVPAGIRLEVGDPVIFRHAKAGELAERFGQWLWIEDGRPQGHYPTYRGEGQCFF